MAKLYAEIQSDYRASKKGKGANKQMRIIITGDNGRKEIAEVNVHNDTDNDQIITTFIPRNCQEFEKATERSKAIALPTKTRRYATSNA